MINSQTLQANKTAAVKSAFGLFTLLAAMALMLSLASPSAFAATYFVSQNGGSVSCGADGTQSTQSAGWFNTAGSYTAGDTLKLCGTFTGAAGVHILSVQASGTSSAKITIQWESNAVVTSPACNGGCIVTNGNSNLVFDGNGTNPSITNTDNGSALGNQLDPHGIAASPCNGCEFKNLTITNLYVHSSTTDTNNGNGVGISINGSNWSIHNSSFDQMYTSIDSAYQNGDNNIQIYGNTFNHFNWGLHIGNNAPTTLTNLYVHDNHLMNMDNWDTVTDSFHHDGIFVVQNNTSAVISNVYIYNNLADGKMSSCSPNTCATAWIYYNTGMNGVYVFNNVLISDGSSFLLEGGIAGDQNFVFFNNYLNCGGSSGTMVNYSWASGWTFENNAVDNCPNPFQNLNSSVTGVVRDYNIYQNYASGETHSLNVGSLAVSSVGFPLTGSPLIHDGTSVFANLSSSCTGGLAALCTDKAGIPRPSSGSNNWDAGAYMYQAGQAVLPPTNLTVTVF